MIHVCPRYVLGVDVAKYQHQAVLWDSLTNQLLGQSFKVSNTASGFQRLLTELEGQGLQGQTLRVGLESTGHYGQHLERFLRQQGHEVVMFNPLETQALAKLSVRKIKTDIIDAERIAHLAKQKQRPSWTPPADIRRLRQLTRFAFRLTRQRSHLQEQLTNLIDRVCPEFSGYFPQLFVSKTALKILERWPDLSSLSRIKPQTFSEFLRRSSRGHIKPDRAQALLTDIRESIAKDYRTNEQSLEASYVLKQYRLVEQQLADVKQRAIIQAKLQPAFTKLTNLVGISEYLAAVLLAEIGALTRFPRPAALAAYAGLDPSVKQSGQYVRRQGNRVSKRGSKYLRRSLYFAAKVSIMFDDDFKAWYQRKRKEGKHYNVVVCALARKKLYQVWYAWAEAEIEK